MAKVKQPLLSLDARRKLGDEIVYGHRQKANIVQVKPMPIDARSVGQLSWRHMFLKVVALWHALSAAEKEAWESLGRKRHMTGYAWFVSQALRPNPGIYLPLQGGIMTGEILMGTNSIRGLPLPTGSGHATRKSYVDGRVTADILTHKGDASAHHIRYSDGEALAAAIAGGLSQVIWKDTSQNAVTDLNRVASLAWTDLDLTAFTSANAKIAILRLQIKMDSTNIGVANFAQLRLRKNGTSPPRFPVASLDGGTFVPGTTLYSHVLLGLDAGEVCEYAVLIGGTIQVDSYIEVLGYIE